MTFVIPHWSATRFMMWEQCPALFRMHYIDDEPLELTEAMLFGQAIHMGLEAHYNGEDGERAFRAAWKQFTAELGGQVGRDLTGTGLRLLDQVFELQLAGVPERGFSLDTNVEFGAPIVGAADLWGNDGVVYDFKTTRGLWSQERAQQEQWQPLLYSYARWDEEPVYDASFEYIVLNRVTGTLQRFRRQWTPDVWVEQMSALWSRMGAISRDLAAGRFDCTGKHGYCPECGARWAHDHVCEQVMQRIRLRG